MSYTNILKPTGTSYTTLPRDATSMPEYGSAIYGVSKYGIQNTYVNILKPTGTSYTNVSKPV